MAEFLIELYVSRSDPQAVEAKAEQARRAADALSREGRAVRFLHSIYVPEEETCFYLFEADGAGAVRETARRAGLPSARVVEAVAEPRVAR